MVSKRFLLELKIMTYLNKNFVCYQSTSRSKIDFKKKKK